MFENISRYKLKDLDEINNNLTVNRNDFKIAIIDDQNISLIRKLNKHNYRIDHFRDLDNIDQLVSYDIIVCDIDGVGKNFGSKFQGGHIINEVYTQLPLKYLICFSGKSFDLSYNKYFSLCDDVMMKSSDINNWVSCLDKAIQDLRNPIFIWAKVRDRLEKTTIIKSDINKLEHIFIKSIIKHKRSYFDLFVTKKKIDSELIIQSTSAFIKIIIMLLKD